jgi:hypothetical protein
VWCHIIDLWEVDNNTFDDGISKVFRETEEIIKKEKR